MMTFWKRGGVEKSEVAELRAKLEESDRRLQSTSRELVAALNKLHASESSPSSPNRSPPRKTRGLGNGYRPPCPCGHDGTSCMEHAASSFWRSFVLAYMVRAGIAVFTRSVGLLRSKNPAEVLRFENLISEKHVFYREEAVRLGMFLGSFTGGYHVVRCQLCNKLGFTPRKAALAAGCASGLSSVFLKKNKRRTLATYLMARLAQAGYASQKNNGRFHFWGSHWDHGDVLLFALSSAQVMYAYVMRPETLDKGFWNFIVRAGPIDRHILGAVRANCGGQPVEMVELLAGGPNGGGGGGSLSGVRSVGGGGGGVVAAGTAAAAAAVGTTGVADIAGLGGALKTNTAGDPRMCMPCIPCAVMHRSTGCTGCVSHVGASAAATFRKCFPFYLSIHLVPFAVLNAARALRDPLGTVTKATAATARSTAFISAFVGLYMGTVCTHRNTVGKDHRALYYVAGLVAASALFIEKKSRRAELALYLMPRAVESLVATMTGKRMLPAVPHAELILFCVVSGGLMHLYENEPDTLAGFVKSTIRRFVHRPNAPLPHSASEAMMQVVYEKVEEEEEEEEEEEAVIQKKNNK